MEKTYQPVLFAVILLAAVVLLDAGREKITGKDVEDIVLAEDIRENILEDAPTSERSERASLNNPLADSVLQAPPSGGNTQGAACTSTSLLQYVMERKSAGNVFPIPLNTYVGPVAMNKNLVAFSTYDDSYQNNVLYIVPLGSDGKPDKQDPPPIVHTTYPIVNALDVYENYVFWIHTRPGQYYSLDYCIITPPAKDGYQIYPHPQGDCYGQPVTLYTPPSQSNLFINPYLTTNDKYVFWEMVDTSQNPVMKTIYACAYTDISPQKGCTNAQPLPITTKDSFATYTLQATSTNLYMHTIEISNNQQHEKTLNYHLPTKTVTTLFDRVQSQTPSPNTIHHIEALPLKDQQDFDMVLALDFGKSGTIVNALPVKQGKGFPPWIPFILSTPTNIFTLRAAEQEPFFSLAYEGFNDNLRTYILGLYSPTRHLQIPVRSFQSDIAITVKANDARGNVIYAGILNNGPYHVSCS